MNDRFRFRVWCEEKRTYWVPRIIEETTLFVLARLSEKKNIVEQCTGLKDENGKLIYEGDIVKVAQLSTNLPVVYYQKFAMFELISNKYLVGLHGSDENLEVIGNIHENPELLESVTNCNQ